MGKKNLEQLYRDSFENYSEVPDPMVWQNIEATLDNRKEKKRVIRKAKEAAFCVDEHMSWQAMWKNASYTVAEKSEKT